MAGVRRLLLCARSFGGFRGIEDRLRVEDARLNVVDDFHQFATVNGFPANKVCAQVQSQRDVDAVKSVAPENDVRPDKLPLQIFQHSHSAAKGHAEIQEQQVRIREMISIPEGVQPAKIMNGFNAVVNEANEFYGIHETKFGVEQRPFIGGIIDDQSANRVDLRVHDVACVSCFQRLNYRCDSVHWIFCTIRWISKSTITLRCTVREEKFLPTGVDELFTAVERFVVHLSDALAVGERALPQHGNKCRRH